jgi:anti-sigma factor RsiW
VKLTRSRALVCQQLVEKVSAYLDGDLSPRHRAAVEEHLAVCDGCAGYVAQVRRLLELTAAAPDGQGEPVLPDTLLQALTAQFRAHHTNPGLP